YRARRASRRRPRRRDGRAGPLRQGRAAVKRVQAGAAVYFPLSAPTGQQSAGVRSANPGRSITLRGSLPRGDKTSLRRTDIYGTRQPDPYPDLADRAGPALRLRQAAQARQVARRVNAPVQGGSAEGRQGRRGKARGTGHGAAAAARAATGGAAAGGPAAAG